MKPILIFRHIACEGPGYLGEVLTRAQIPYQVARIDQGDPVPSNPEPYSGLVFMGGPMSVNDSLAWIESELDLIRRAADRGMPILGHCLGGQLIARALGGSVVANPNKEIGWHPVERLPNAQAQTWLSNWSGPTELFHWHGETFVPPPGATPILRSELCENQGFVLDNVLALQCHVEMTPDLVVTWAQEYASELEAGGIGVQSLAQMSENLDQRIAALHRVADALYAHWLRPLHQATV